MPPRLRLQAKRLRLCTSNASYLSCQCRYASLAAATTPAAPVDHMMRAPAPVAHHAAAQPPPYKPAEFRKTQLHRLYASLIRSSPMMLVFQHNNLKAVEFSGIRRELGYAMKKVDDELVANGTPSLVGQYTALQIVQTGIFASALKVVEAFHPEQSRNPASAHSLSKGAYMAARRSRAQTGLEPLLSGPLLVLTFPLVSPQHLKAALSILAPSEGFPAPKRKANPGYHELPIQDGLKKMMLLGARVEGKVFDLDGTKWVGGIPGGIDGLRAQLVQMLQSLPATLKNTLEGASKSLYVTMESRRQDLEGPENKDEST